MHRSFDSDADPLTCFPMSLLRRGESSPKEQELVSAPLFSLPAEYTIKSQPEDDSAHIPQYNLLAGIAENIQQPVPTDDSSKGSALDPRIFFNISAPSSTFICGSQGSGKSHTLSCILEGCLIPSNAGNLPKALTALVFHYDTFISDDGGSPCEAAFLASDDQIQVRVLCSPTNIRTIQRSYHSLDVTIEPLRIDPADLNTKRMMDLMAINQEDGPVPLYIHTVYRILRQMRLAQQELGIPFQYDVFKTTILASGLTPAQLGPLNQRLETLESFLSMPKDIYARPKNSKRGTKSSSTNWDPKAGLLTIIDLSCPCVNPESACSLFNVCLSIFLEQDMSIGRVIALDEAHKFMNKSAEALAFTDTLLSTIRLQRHLGSRVIISTQEPSISAALMDLSSITVVHRFTSPEWLHSLRSHLAGAYSDPNIKKHDFMAEEKEEKTKQNSRDTIFKEIVGLRVGEALLFAPNGMVCLDSALGSQRLGTRYLKVNIRSRLTTDGGRSVMAM